MERNKITEANTKPPTDANSEFSQWNQELEQLAQAGVKLEIAQHKAIGRPVFSSRQSVPIMELADGCCFEYQRLEDGTR